MSKLLIRNLSAVLVAVVTGDPENPANVTTLKPNDEITVDSLQVAVIDEHAGGFNERRNASQALTGRRASDQMTTEARSVRGFFARGRELDRPAGADVYREPANAALNAGGGVQSPGASVAAPSGGGGGGTGATDDGSGVLKTAAGEHVQGDTSAAARARDTGKKP